MKVVTYNIRYGLGLVQCYDLERIANAVHGADVIVLQEVERYWRRSGMTDQPEILGELLPDYYWKYYPAFDVDASTRQNSGSILHRRRQFGLMIMSRWPILSTRTIVLPQLKTDQLFNMSSGAIEALISTPLGHLRTYTLHLSSISERERLLQIDTLFNTHNWVSRTNGVYSGSGITDDPVESENFINMDWNNGEPALPEPEHALFMGDFNSIEESQEYIRFAGQIDPIYGRGMHSDALIDSWNASKEKIGDPITWWPDPPERSPGHGLRLDYCFISPGLASSVSRTWIDSEANGSDHKPYWIEFNE